jgi:hypothetical protein
MTVRFNWGTGIALVCTTFAAATAGIAAFAMSRPVVLVTPDYYAESLRQDERSQAIRNSRGLGDAVSIVQTSPRQLTVSIPREQVLAARGTVTLYRAADAAADRTIDLAPDPDGHQLVRLQTLAPGHWVVQLRWTAVGRDYYSERELTLP